MLDWSRRKALRILEFFVALSSLSLVRSTKLYFFWRKKAVFLVAIAVHKLMSQMKEKLGDRGTLFRLKHWLICVCVRWWDASKRFSRYPFLVFCHSLSPSAQFPRKIQLVRSLGAGNLFIFSRLVMTDRNIYHSNLQLLAMPDHFPLSVPGEWGIWLWGLPGWWWGIWTGWGGENWTGSVDKQGHNFTSKTLHLFHQNCHNILNNTVAQIENMSEYVIHSPRALSSWITNTWPRCLKRILTYSKGETMRMTTFYNPSVRLIIIRIVYESIKRLWPL